MKIQTIRLIDQQSAKAAANLIYDSTGKIPAKVMRIISEDALRNLEQNALFHVIIGQMAEQSTHYGDGKYISATVMKEWIVSMHLPAKTIHLPNGTQSVKRQSTTTLSRKAFAKLINHTLTMASEMEMTIEFLSDRGRKYLDGNKEWYL